MRADEQRASRGCGEAGERAQLASCYRRCLQVAREHRIESSAFPGVSTGIYRYPQREAADTAIATIAAELAHHALPRRVVLCTYDALATSIMTGALTDAFAASGARGVR